MKTIAVSNGDIQLNGGKLVFAQASQKLVQDLTRWLEEPLGLKDINVGNQTGFTAVRIV